ncbi:16S rRNA (cytidine(1402)-2'-O)-methyltransferase [Mycetocola reblochoni]|uniref:Ribosomal RNA small subunit methyltransferase I n=2 Tax=Mycetocola reblochoni TaxID=331618 RepID=A0A1R4JGL9_9MICO|nr:16S rRNA (cytidine(1402)-2'-O)-methyltransferase [Mycetocola reblochoni]RLP68241.1 16S rRNA (cytidine(1402)-2'-O)-methyltransferase [Mycetocola reblochoni]SJN31168.1 rRNA small subunit methyltransferase I [Mycetocola reblochoni REB411]
MIILAATPIGNLGDASRRLVEALENATLVAAEDTRTTVRLLQALGVANRPRLVALHDHNERDRAAEIVERARDEDVLVLSDAGMPTVSDPGYHLVEAAVAAGVDVTALPGPSAVVTALALSGLPTDRFAFDGFLPRRPSERRRTLRAVAEERRTLVFFESPHRIADALADVVSELGAGRRVAVCRELTKLHEEVARGSAAELAAWAADGVRGEIVLVVAGAAEREADPEDALARVQALVASGVRLKDATAQVAGETGAARRELYQRALTARQDQGAPSGPPGEG